MRKPFIKVQLSGDWTHHLTDGDGNSITGYHSLTVNAPHGGTPSLTVTFNCHIKNGVYIGSLPCDQFGDVNVDAPEDEKDVPRPVGLTDVDALNAEVSRLRDLNVSIVPGWQLILEEKRHTETKHERDSLKAEVEMLSKGFHETCIAEKEGLAAALASEKRLSMKPAAAYNDMVVARHTPPGCNVCGGDGINVVRVFDPGCPKCGRVMLTPVYSGWSGPKGFIDKQTFDEVVRDRDTARAAHADAMEKLRTAETQMGADIEELIDVVRACKGPLRLCGYVGLSYRAGTILAKYQNKDASK